MNAPAPRLNADDLGARSTDAAQPETDAADAGACDSADGARLIGQLQLELNRIQRSVRRMVQGKLAGLTGRNLGDLAANRSMVAAVQALLETHSLRICCPQCGHPAILRVSPRKGMPGGAFVMDHTVAGRRTFHGGGATVPVIHLMAKPKRA